MRKIAWLLLALVLFLAACNDEETESATAYPVQEEAVMDEFVDTMYETFEGDFAIEFDAADNLYTFTIVDTELAYEILQIMNGDLDISYWYQFTDSLATTSELLSEGYGEDYTILLQNPANNDKSIYMVSNGVSIYDIMNE